MTIKTNSDLINFATFTKMRMVLIHVGVHRYYYQQVAILSINYVIDQINPKTTILPKIKDSKK